MVGTAVYQFALYWTKSFQNSEAENLGGTTADPPAARGARKPASRPWTWNRGITSIVRSCSVKAYVAWMFSEGLISYAQDDSTKLDYSLIVRVRFRWVRGTWRAQCERELLSSGIRRSTYGLRSTGSATRMEDEGNVFWLSCFNLLVAFSS